VRCEASLPSCWLTQKDPLQDRFSPSQLDTMHNSSSRRSRGVLDAYRAVNGRSPAALSGDDGTWLYVGSLLENAASLPTLERQPYLDIVGRTIRGVIGEELWRTGHRTDPPELRSDSSLEGRLRVFCEVIEDAGAPEVSDAVLSAYLLASTQISAMERGRIEAVRGRLAWKRGDLDAAEERYRHVALAARRMRSDELRVRAWSGRAVVARLRGNYPASRRYGQHAIILAERSGLHRLASLAHHALMVAAAVGKEFESAVEHGWQAYLNAEGDLTLESGALGNIGQLFLDAGHPSTAIAAFRAAIARHPSDRIVVPALGGLAVAAARLDLPELVSTATNEILLRDGSGATTYDVATAMLDLARAYLTLGDDMRAEEFRARAHALALSRGFPEIVYYSKEASRAQRNAPRERILTPRMESLAADVLHLISV
jgi:tetratricopeptide (TPR) repeat protein